MDPTASQPRSPPLRRSTRLAKELRTARLALLASVVLHLLVLALFPTFSQPYGRFPAELRGPSLVADDFGIEVVILPGDEPAQGALGRPDAPAPGNVTPAASLPADIPLSDGGSEERIEEATDESPRPSVAERLLPQMVDPRLWAPVELIGIELTDMERAELLLSGMIRSWNDSVAIALALSDRATDWTYTDGQGRRWGLSPGRLHLGDFSIPLPFSFGGGEGNMLRRRELSDLEWIRQDLERARIQGEIHEVWVERARAIRERMETERREASQGEGGGP